MRQAAVLMSLLLLLGAGAPRSARADLAAVIDKIKPSVVIVGTFKATNSPRFALRGTGFVVEPGNWVVTNAHVIPDGQDIDPDARLVVQARMGPNELQMRQVVVLEVDKDHDLALLQLEGPPLPAVQMRDSDKVREGQGVAFMGFPIGGALGYSPVTHRGMVSSITAIAPPSASSRQLNSKSILSLRGGSFDIFQLDATAYPGNSGGPLFDAETGEVLGVINSVFVKNTKESVLTNPSGISYAIPAKYIVQLLQRRKER